ncbi:Tip elongation aberrant protein 1 [Phytophthora citrophthora]|uniref:Tip elongation aberrant protein 1 n=1 Tax=Phytophthora citrophthora TaxID=4793 RepID=A0AAD9H0N2_9STRA|nr:Tip elongation aberrant protein 1 [Phytophthora citrophthora]
MSAPPPRVEGAVSDWLRERVDLCMYVEKLDFRKDQDPEFVCDSYRKSRWVREKQRRQLEARRQQQDTKDTLLKEVEDNSMTELPVKAAVGHNDEPEDVPDIPVEDSNDPLGVLMGDVLRGYNVSVKCRGVLPAHGSDPLETISIPCVREGNSLTLCPVAGGSDQLVIFGGRVRQDTSMLLPRAVRSDPMQFERVRYTYSNSVYSFNLVSSTWTRRECSGVEPRERSDHSALFMAPQHLLVFGGRGRNGQVFRDFFALSLTLWHWTQLDDTSATPYERYWHGWCIAFDMEQQWQQEPSIFLFGGKSDTLVYDNLHQLQTTRLKRLLDDEDEHKRKYTLDIGETSAQRQLERKVSDVSRLLMKERECQRLAAWFVPTTVGKPPSARFGMQVVALENEQLAVIGGWRIPKNKTDTQKSRSLDVHILDLTTLVWSTPRLSTLVSAQPYIPSERLLFECFYVHQTLVLFGGYTYVSNGETESFTACEDSTMLYKLDVNRMIWRRQKFPVAGDDETAVALPLAHSHGSSNAVFNTSRAFTCSSEMNSLQLQLTAFDIHTPKPKKITGKV